MSKRTNTPEPALCARCKQPLSPSEYYSRSKVCQPACEPQKRELNDLRAQLAAEKARADAAEKWLDRACALLGSDGYRREVPDRVEKLCAERDAAIARAQEAEREAGFYKTEIANAIARAEAAERERDEQSALARADNGELWSDECERARAERDAARAEVMRMKCDHSDVWTAAQAYLDRETANLHTEVERLRKALQRCATDACWDIQRGGTNGPCGRCLPCGARECLEGSDG